MPGFTRCSLKTIMAPTTPDILLLNSIDMTISGGLEKWMEKAGRYDSHFIKKVSTHEVVGA
jgi:hypothetical protein